MKRIHLLLAMAVLFVLCGIPAHAQGATQFNSAAAAVNLSYQINSSLTVSGTPASVTFTGSTPTTGAISVTTAWQLASGYSHVDTNIYFATPTAALSDGSGDNIPSSQVFANIGGGAYSACNKNEATDITGLPAGGVCNVGFGQAITSANLTGTNTSVFTLQLQGLSASLPAGSYTGVLNIVAGAS